MSLPSDQGKYGDAKGKQSHDDAWDCHAER